MINTIYNKLFHIIVAFDNNRGIGKDGSIPWNIPEDMQKFKKLTTDYGNQDALSVVIMGRKTWESLPQKPLSNRINIVISGTLSNNVKNIQADYQKYPLVYKTFDEALDFLVTSSVVCHMPWVIGGERLYEEALNHTGLSYVIATEIGYDFNCDTFFPAIPSSICNNYDFYKRGNINVCNCEYYIN